MRSRTSSASAPHPHPAANDAGAPARPPSARRAAFERWRDEALIPRVFDVSAEIDRFHSRLDHRGVGSAAALEYEMSATRYHRTAERARRDGMDHIWVQLIRAGGLMGTSLDRSTILAPGAAGLCDFSVATEQYSFASSGRALLIPRDAFAGVDVRKLHGAAVTGARYDLLNDYVGWLVLTSRRARAEDAERIAEAIAGVVVACMSPHRAVGEVAGAELGPVALHRARTFIAARLASDLDASEIARAAGVSRSTLYRLCAPHGGVAELVWSMRLDAARRSLSDPEREERIIGIADDAGFTSAQHFSRRFRRSYGFSPRDLRPF